MDDRCRMTDRRSRIDPSSGIRDLSSGISNPRPRDSNPRGRSAMPSASEAAARSAFGEVFGGAPDVVARAPGRVELLGNHTDHNGGLVLAAAIDRFTAVAGRACPGARRGSCRRTSSRPRRSTSTRSGPASPGRGGGTSAGWSGPCAERGPAASGFEAAIAGDVPLGAGLSSSASLQASVALFLLGGGIIGRGPGAILDDADRLALAQRAAEGREPVRRRRVGAARPVHRPVRPRRPRAAARLPQPVVRAAAAGRPRAGDRRVRLEDVAEAGRRDVQPPPRRVRIGGVALPIEGGGRGGARPPRRVARHAPSFVGRARPGRAAPRAARPVGERTGRAGPRRSAPATSRRSAG